MTHTGADDRFALPPPFGDQHIGHPRFIGPSQSFALELGYYPIIGVKTGKLSETWAFRAFKDYGVSPGACDAFNCR